VIEVNDTKELLQRAREGFAPPEDFLGSLVRRRERNRRNQRIAAGILGIAVFVAPVALFVGLSSVDRTQTPTPAGPSEAVPGVAEIDPLVDSINRCHLPLVTPEEVRSALGFLPGDPARFERGVEFATYPAAQVEGWGGVVFGCEYASVYGGGEVVISAYTADAPPPLGRSEPVQGIGDEAEFSPYGNGDRHLDGYGPESATSVLQVRSGELILRFNGTWGGYSDAALGNLRQLAENALNALEGILDPRVVSINECERLLVTRQEVASVLSSHAGRPQRTRSVTVSKDCTYTSYTRSQGSGHLWIYADTVDADGLSVPFPSRTRPVQGIGDRAEFSPGDVGPVEGPERRTTILRVWTGDLILTFEGRGVWDSYGLPAMQQLAEDALTTLDEGT
jgi:hypothetical protein